MKSTMNGVVLFLGMRQRRHKDDTKNFDELTYEEQAKSLNMAALQFRKRLDAHLRRADSEGRLRSEVLEKRLSLLEGILADYKPEPVTITGRLAISDTKI